MFIFIYLKHLKTKLILYRVTFDLIRNKNEIMQLKLYVIFWLEHAHFVPPRSFTQVSQSMQHSQHQSTTNRPQFSHTTRSLLTHGEVTPCQIKNHVQRKFATPILYAIDIFKNHDFFSLHTYPLIISFVYFFEIFSHLHFFQ